MAEERSCRVSQGDEHAAVSIVLATNRTTAQQRGRIDEKRKEKNQHSAAKFIFCDVVPSSVASGHPLLLIQVD